MNTAQPTVWTGTVSDEQQAKVPWVVGVALVLGVFLWMGPYMGVNVVLLPAKTALLAGDGKASVVAVLSTSAMIVAAIANIIFGALSDLTRSRFGRRSPWIIGGSVLAAAAMMFVSWAPTVPLLIVGWCVYQCFLNAIVAPLIAVITDRTAPKFRGTISAKRHVCAWLLGWHLRWSDDRRPIPYGPIHGLYRTCRAYADRRSSRRSDHARRFQPGHAEETIHRADVLGAFLLPDETLP